MLLPFFSLRWTKKVRYLYPPVTLNFPAGHTLPCWEFRTLNLLNNNIPVSSQVNAQAHRLLFPKWIMDMHQGSLQEAKCGTAPCCCGAPWAWLLLTLGKLVSFQMPTWIKSKEPHFSFIPGHCLREQKSPSVRPHCHLPPPLSPSSTIQLSFTFLPEHPLGLLRLDLVSLPISLGP